jgi:hypothetical protein
MRVSGVLLGFVGTCLIVVGALIAMTAGMCSLGVIKGMTDATSDVGGILTVLGIFGGIPFLFGLVVMAGGAGCFVLAWVLRNRGRARPNREPPGAGGKPG